MGDRQDRIHMLNRERQLSRPWKSSLLTSDFCVSTLDFLLPGLSKAFRSNLTASGILSAAPCVLLSALCLLLTGCKVGPNYQRPPAPAPSAYKELPSDNSPQAAEWKTAQPSDAMARGKWWEIYNDPELNALEEQVSVSNQSLKAAEAQFREARFAVKIARSALYPSFTVAPNIINSP